MAEMNPIFKAWLLDTLRKAGTSGGATVLEEIMAQVPTDIIVRIRDICNRIMKKRGDEAQPVPSTSKKSASNR